MNKPTIGRIVIYVLNHGKNVGAHRPAIICNVLDAEAGKVALTVFPDSARDGYGQSFHTHETAHDPAGAPNTWHWPFEKAAATDAEQRPGLQKLKSGNAEIDLAAEPPAEGENE